MNKFIVNIIVVFGIICLYSKGNAQVTISGVINKYAQVNNIISASKVEVINVSNFSEGDTVLLIQMKGASVSGSGYVSTMNGAGRYEFIIIKSINTSTGVVEFQTNIINSAYYLASEGLQLVRVPTYKNAIVKSGGLTCDAWDGNKGGIIALIVSDTLELKDSIYANVKGYLGANYTVNSGLCPTWVGVANYTQDKTDSAGLKGEGVVSNSFVFKRGRGYVANAGGGGFGKFSGGGGGGNYGSGGTGGKMDETCTDPNSSSGGIGGITSISYFGGTVSEYRDRVFMGGGGGAGTGLSASDGTKGGNGGGIVFIIARTLITNGNLICTRGENISIVSSNKAGAGGGGAGGSVILAVDDFSGALNIYAPGGKGGGTSYCSGQGGGGGGGFVWLSRSSQTFSLLVYSGGKAGLTPLPPGVCTNLAYSGAAGNTAYNFVPVLNGFLSNSIESNQTICYGQIPNALIGSYPKGGNGTYTFRWQKRKRGTSEWLNISGATSRDYLSVALFDSTEFRRVVKSYQVQWADSVADTSKYVTINVISQIKNNIIDADTSVCTGLPQVILRGKTPSGGVGSFTYMWQSNDNISGWEAAAAPNNSLNYSASNTKTQYYRRIVYSPTFCSDTSDVDTVLIYNNISGNVVGVKQMICYNSYPNALTGLNTISGGSSSYSYVWEKSPDSTIWQPVAGNSPNYAPGKLIAKTYFHRIVYSGLNHTCKDVSSGILIDITPSIDHVKNSIAASQTICKNILPNEFTGGSSSGGNSSYSYQWEMSDNQVKWDSIVTIANLNYQYPSSLDTTTYFRRIVRSGILDCCKDTSSSLIVTVQPLITNNIIKSQQEICQNQKPVLLTQNSGSVGGGNGTTYAYTWEGRLTSDFNWSSPLGTISSYQPPVLTQSMYYRRKVVSGACTDFSDSLKIMVLETLVGNVLVGKNEVCRDLPSDNLSGGPMSKGKPFDYRYTWQDSISGGIWNSIATATDSFYSPGVLSVSKYFRRIVKSGLNDCCISKSSPFQISINELPVGALIAMDTAICQGNTLNVRVDLLSGVAPLDVRLKGISNEFEKNNLTPLGRKYLNITPTVARDTLHIESLIDSKGCLAKTKPGLAVIRLVTVPQANAGSDSSICGLQCQLHATLTPGIMNAAGLWVDKTGLASLSPSFLDKNATVSYNSYGTYKILWREINEFCFDSAEISLSFYEQPVKPYLGADTSLYYQFNYTLSAPVPLAGSGQWSSPGSEIQISSVDSPITEVSNMVFGINVFVWTIANGTCKLVSDTLQIYVDDIKQYTGFSPNGDGKNDEFIIEGLDNAAQKKITILNRWGGVVYSNSNYDNKWKGVNNNGDILPDDTYFYVLVVDKSREYKGFIVLKR